MPSSLPASAARRVRGHVFAGGCGIAAGMVVGQQQRGAAVTNGFAKQVGHARIDRVHRALSDLEDPQDAMAGIEQDHHQAFVAGAAQVAGEHTGPRRRGFQWPGVRRPLRFAVGAPAPTLP